MRVISNPAVWPRPAWLSEPQEPSKPFGWVSTKFGIEPRWTAGAEIDAKLIMRVIEAAQPMRCLEVGLFAEGPFHKVYTVGNTEETFIMRIPMPLDPRWKTASEAATMEWMRQNITAVPVPRVVDFQDDRDNALGLEWILMTKIPGIPLSTAWRSISMRAKKRIVQRFALLASALFQKQFRGIGNIYLDMQAEPSVEHKFTDVGRLVSKEFFWGDRLEQIVPRGPFSASRDWMASRLILREREYITMVASAKDEDELEDSTKAKRHFPLRLSHESLGSSRRAFNALSR